MLCGRRCVFAQARYSAAQHSAVQYSCTVQRAEQLVHVEQSVPVGIQLGKQLPVLQAPLVGLRAEAGMDSAVCGPGTVRCDANREAS